ncbi:M6 family metalloprotease domain-containing protein [Clostridium sp. Marseille-P2415]|uniref:M6 family metalloprotease domain-containing protein n=1 Tax=Clostridium sp. Marseille-P2415 TaxID=1805471 RepID=UPI0009886023|nr:M6 family metalloprotease domain-containing protein [Clostridium sp. Marseille-P2415]
MRKTLKLLTTAVAVATMFTVTNTQVSAAPYSHKKYELVQPDGSKVQVDVTGDEYFQQIESLDGYTLCRDENGWICYAKLNENQTDYVSTGQIYKTNAALNNIDSIDETDHVKNNLEKHLKIKNEAIKEKADTVRKRLHALDFKNTPEAKNRDSNGLLDSKIKASGDVKGLTILIDFPDTKSSISKSEIERFFNGTDYTGFNNNGSIRDYYYDVSGGKVTYTNTLLGFYTAKHPKSYYDDIYEETGSYAKADELTEEAVQWLKSTGFDLSTLTTDSNGYLKAVNILYAGTADAGWAKGLWPHQSWYPKSENINGAKIQKYEMSDIGNNLSIYTICHESGHMIYGYPDLYDYDGDSQGTGAYSLMSTAANEKNPVPPDPYCRNIISGWNTPMSMNEYGAGTTFAAVADSNGNSYSYQWSGNKRNEYYLIENIQKNGRYADVPDAGLAIWHVDENGDNSRNEMTSGSHYLVSLEQADGKFDLEKNRNGGDRGDLFRGGYKDSFTDITTPNSKWWNNSASGLEISQISNLADEMTFIQSASTPTPDPQLTNIAGQAAASASYVSDWENISALNDGIDPSSSNDRSGAVYGNWPETGTQWVQYVFPKNFTISGCDVYWFKDGQGIDVPASYNILYWDGNAWQNVKNPKGLGTEINKYNSTTFTPVTTNGISITMDSKGGSSTGILEWKVYGK